MKTKKQSYRHRLVCAIPYSLLHFLIAYNCLKQYLDNCCREKDESFLTSMEKERKLAYLYFTAAFSWETSPEGYDFWSRRTNWYIKYLLNNKL